MTEESNCLKMSSVYDDKNYQEFINEMTYEKFCKYMKDNQGATVDDICKTWGCKRLYCETILNVWTQNWNSFYQCGGRVVHKKGRYYILSPRNPQSRARNPQINYM